MIIGIDPGHGGRDPGAIGPAGTLEKDINLAIARELVSLLTGREMFVYLTRMADTSVSLKERSRLLNAAQVDYVISIHCNASSSPDPCYISTFIQAGGGQAEKLARLIQNELVTVTGWPNGGVRTANMYITRETKAPAVLVECGFISNPTQERQLADPLGPFTRKEIARAIYTGLMTHLELQADPAPADPDPWKHDLVAKAVDMGLLDYPHDPDEPAPKWFVVEVVMDALRKMKVGDI